MVQVGYDCISVIVTHYAFVARVSIVMAYRCTVMGYTKMACMIMVSIYSSPSSVAPVHQLLDSISRASKEQPRIALVVGRGVHRRRLQRLYGLVP